MIHLIMIMINRKSVHHNARAKMGNCIRTSIKFTYEYYVITLQNLYWLLITFAWQIGINYDLVINSIASSEAEDTYEYVKYN